MFYMIIFKLHMQCLYLPSVKASALHDILDLEGAGLFNIHPAMRDHRSILDRLDRIESALGIDRDVLEDPAASPVLPRSEDGQSVSIQGAWDAVAHLRSITRPAQEEAVWARPNVKRLWTS